LLLSLLDPGVAAEMIGLLDADKQPAFSAEIQRLEREPPPLSLVETVVDEFESVFRSLRDGVPGPAATPASAARTAAARGGSGSDESASQETAFRAQLAAIEPPRLAAALQQELPESIAVVCVHLETAAAGALLGCLPPELRNQTMMCLDVASQTPQQLVELTLQTVIDKALQVDMRKVEEAAKPREQKLAQVLRSMSREDRQSSFARLEVHDPDLAEAVRNLLFEFSDIQRLDDRSIKKLLAEVEMPMLSVALKDGPSEVRDRIVANLSRRAGEALAEEIEFLAPPTTEERRQAESQIVAVLSRLDQDGELQMTS
jgi:flagellar motor switch protein FliG